MKEVGKVKTTVMYGWEKTDFLDMDMLQRPVPMVHHNEIDIRSNDSGEKSVWNDLYSRMA